MTEETTLERAKREWEEASRAASKAEEETGGGWTSFALVQAAVQKYEIYEAARNADKEARESKK